MRLFAVASRAGAALDLAALRLMERAMTASGPGRPPRDVRQRLGRIAAHYRELGPSFFAPPPPPEAREVEVRRRTKGNTELLDVEIDSAYLASLPTYRDELLGYRENQRIRARLFRRRRRGAAPVVICLHGWGSGHYWLEERAFRVDRLLEAGFDAALFQLPLHYQRAPGRSGALFPGPHVVRTNECFGQAIWDLRRLRAFLAGELGAPAIGVTGMSLGGYVTALWAGLDADLGAAVPMIPAVSMADLMWRHGAGSAMRERARRAGVDRDLLAAAFAVHAPLERPVALPPERLMIVAGRGDRITPPDQALALWRHWGEPRLHWFPGGHLAQLGRRRALAEVRAHLGGSLLPPQAVVH